MFTLIQINNSEGQDLNYYPPTLTNTDKLPPNHPINLYFQKTKKSKEIVEFEKGFDDFRPALAELLSFLLIRMAGRFTKDELPYFCEELGRNPTFDEFEGKDKFYSTDLH